MCAAIEKMISQKPVEMIGFDLSRIRSAARRTCGFLRDVNFHLFLQGSNPWRPCDIKFRPKRDRTAAKRA
jgi:hypothetical protein